MTDPTLERVLTEAQTRAFETVIAAIGEDFPCCGYEWGIGCYYRADSRQAWVSSSADEPWGHLGAAAELQRTACSPDQQLRLIRRRALGPWETVDD